MTYTGTGTKDGHVTITFTYTGTTTSNGYAAIYYGLYIAKPGEVPDQGKGKTNGANAWSGGSLQTTVDIGGSGATSIQLAPSAIIAGEISGLKFNDLNGNGTKDTGELGLAGWTICLDSDSDPSNGYLQPRPDRERHDRRPGRRRCDRSGGLLLLLGHPRHVLRLRSQPDRLDPDGAFHRLLRPARGERDDGRRISTRTSAIARTRAG